jgi:hypothetical protein
MNLSYKLSSPCTSHYVSYNELIGRFMIKSIMVNYDQTIIDQKLIWPRLIENRQSIVELSCCCRIDQAQHTFVQLTIQLNEKNPAYKHRTVVLAHQDDDGNVLQEDLPHIYSQYIVHRGCTYGQKKSNVESENDW